MAQIIIPSPSQVEGVGTSDFEEITKYSYRIGKYLYVFIPMNIMPDSANVYNGYYTLRRTDFIDYIKGRLDPDKLAVEMVSLTTTNTNYTIAMNIAARDNINYWKYKVIHTSTGADFTNTIYIQTEMHMKMRIVD